MRFMYWRCVSLFVIKNKEVCWKMMCIDEEKTVYPCDIGQKCDDCPCKDDSDYEAAMDYADKLYYDWLNDGGVYHS